MSTLKEKKWEHPLLRWAFKQFDNGKAHDDVTFAVAMGSPANPSSAFKAYKSVAHDLMLLLEGERLIDVDSRGWWRATGRPYPWPDIYTPIDDPDTTR
jgi:hypothetical protein